MSIQDQRCQWFTLQKPRYQTYQFDNLNAFLLCVVSLPSLPFPTFFSHASTQILLLNLFSMLLLWRHSSRTVTSFCHNGFSFVCICLFIRHLRKIAWWEFFLQLMHFCLFYQKWFLAAGLQPAAALGTTYFHSLSSSSCLFKLVSFCLFLLKACSNLLRQHCLEFLAFLSIVQHCLTLLSIFS